MNYAEYEKVKKLSYYEYCDYLQNKYGIGKANYFYPSWNKNKKVSRTSEGLIAHHKMETEACLLSTPSIARNFPYEWQKAENIVYCDYLEHLFLHILMSEINECQDEDMDDNIPNIRYPGGILEFLIPELNDVYSGWETKMQWRKNCYEKIIKDKNVYLALVKRFKLIIEKQEGFISEEQIYKSYNEQFGLWLSDKNKRLYEEMRKV